MKYTQTISHILKIAAITILSIPGIVFAVSGGQPIMTVLGVKDIASTQATVAVSFDSGTAQYSGLWEIKPIISVQYINASTGSQLVTSSYEQAEGSRTVPFVLKNLVPNTFYQYRAIMVYNGQTIQTPFQNFVTTKTDPLPATTPTTTTTETTTTSGSSSSIKTSAPATVAKTAGITKVANNLQNIVMTGGYGSKNGVAMSITNSHARVVGDDLLTYTIQYHNSNQRTLKTSRIVVDLPDQYAFDQGDANTVSDTGSNIVTIYLGTIEPNESGEVTFKARAIGPDNVAVTTKANLVYLGGSVSAADRDTYVGGSKSALGASVFGAGFFPQTFFGWILVILVLTIVVIAARRYISKPK